VLFVIGADATVIRTPIDGAGMRPGGIFARFVIIPDLLIVFYIHSQQHFLKTMFFTALGEIDIFPLENDLRAHLPVAFVAKTYRMIIVYIIPFIFHKL
jgi:hypothetical protein